MSKGQLDLSRLAIDRTSPAEAPLSQRRRNSKWVVRYLLPAAILFSFVALVVAATGFQLMPRQKVEVMPVIVKRSVVQKSGTPLFRTAGWVEPRPTSTLVPSLASGVVEELLVVEGQDVKKNDPIAKLLTVDAEIAVEQARVELETCIGNLEQASAEFRAAKIRLDNPAHLQVQLADAEIVLARAEMELAKLPFQIQSSISQLAFAKKSLDAKKAAGSAVPGVVLKKAESEWEAAQADLEELQQRKPHLLRETKAIQAKVAALQSQLKLLVEENRQLEEAKAKVQSLTALRDAAKIGLKSAKLELSRNTILAPIDGRILRLIASPGTRVVGMNTKQDPNQSAVVEMYSPSRLQVRADVRLEDVPLVQPNQEVQIETPSSKETIIGKVLQANSTANIQKNTLEVKVAILDPPDTIRPEMLVTATFVAPEVKTDEVQSKDSATIFIPQQLVTSDDNGDFVWVVDSDQRARRQKIETGMQAAGDLLEITNGLAITDKLVASDPSGLSDGKKITVSGQNKSIGK